jgi:hypothetical protein
MDLSKPDLVPLVVHQRQTSRCMVFSQSLFRVHMCQLHSHDNIGNFCMAFGDIKFLNHAQIHLLNTN